MVKPGVGGNGTASELGDLTGLSRTDAEAFLMGLGATKTMSASGEYITYSFPDKSRVYIRTADGRVSRTPAPRYALDGRNLNKGLRLNQQGALLQTRDANGNPVSGTHNVDEFVNSYVRSFNVSQSWRTDFFDRPCSDIKVGK